MLALWWTSDYPDSSKPKCQVWGEIGRDSDAHLDVWPNRISCETICASRNRDKIEIVTGETNGNVSNIGCYFHGILLKERMICEGSLRNSPVVQKILRRKVLEKVLGRKSLKKNLTWNMPMHVKKILEKDPWIFLDPWESHWIFLDPWKRSLDRKSSRSLNFKDLFRSFKNMSALFWPRYQTCNSEWRSSICRFKKCEN